MKKISITGWLYDLFCGVCEKTVIGGPEIQVIGHFCAHFRLKPMLCRDTALALYQMFWVQQGKHRVT